MKFFAIASGVAFAVTGTLAQLASPTQTYNVSSPVTNGLYVAGQVLPCTVDIFANIASELALSVTLTSSTNSSISYVVTSNFDTSKSGSTKTNNNVTYYEHSYNYNIPTNITTGAYNVIFFDSYTNTNLNVPINVLPVASASVVHSIASSTVAASASATTSQGSVTKHTSAATTMTPSKIMISLAAIAAFAAMA
ncbi:unnamed protein product [Rhizopus stolonifer]